MPGQVRWQHVLAGLTVIVGMVADHAWTCGRVALVPRDRGELLNDRVWQLGGEDMIVESLFVAASIAAGTGAGTTQDAKEPCCFSNPRYSGVCREVPEGDDTCAGILSYLNNPTSSGKTYCGSTTVRGGWEQVACVPPEQQGAPGTA